MANSYSDQKELKHYLHHPLMERIVSLREGNFESCQTYSYAPKSVEDAMDNYDKVLEIVGDICTHIIAPNAAGVDKEGPVCADGKVCYASGTTQNLQA
jgi:hypothetical protein